MTLVGEDETDVANGRISWYSPDRAGDPRRRRRRRPRRDTAVGEKEYEVVAIDYPEG